MSGKQGLRTKEKKVEVPSGPVNLIVQADGNVNFNLPNDQNRNNFENPGYQNNYQVVSPGPANQQFSPTQQILPCASDQQQNHFENFGYPYNQQISPLEPPPYYDDNERPMKKELTSCANCLIPKLPKWVAIIFFIMNCILPGWGAMCASLVSCCFEQDREDDCCCCEVCGCCGIFCFGLLQFVFAPVFLVGWVWSIIWGYQLYKISCEPTNHEEMGYVSKIPTAPPVPT